MLNWFKSLWSRVVKIFKAFVEEAIDDVTMEVIAELKDFAIDTVASLSVEDITSAAKRKKAIAAIKAEAKKRGIALSGSVGNLLIELALQYVKNNV